MKNKNVTGERIKKLRKKNKMTQAELAEKAGYSDKSSIAKIEKGESNIGNEKLAKLASVLGVETAYLTGATNTLYDAEGRPMVRKLVARFSNPDCTDFLTDDQLEKIDYQLNNTTIIDVDFNDLLIEMLSNKEISEGEMAAVIRYGNPFMPGNQCEYSVYIKGETDPIIIFKCYINRFEPTFMLKWFKVTVNNSLGFERSVIEELIRISHLFMLTKFYVGDVIVDNTKITPDDDAHDKGIKFFESFDYGKMRLEINK